MTRRPTISTGRAVLLQAALNGDRRPGEHSGVPVAPHALARDAVAVAKAGAGAVHLHPRSGAGEDSLSAVDVAAAVSAVRAAAPGLPVGVTTGAWAALDPVERVRLVEGWAAVDRAARPDFASVNWHEDGAAEVADALLSAGVGIEAGLFHLQAIEAWTRWRRFRGSCVRVLLEIPDGPDGATTALLAADMIEAVRASATRAPLLLHGEGSSCWPALHLAVDLGLDVRVGLEDTLHLPDGAVAPSNADLVAAAREIVSARGRAPG